MSSLRLPTRSLPLLMLIAATIIGCQRAPTLKTEGGMSFVWNVASFDPFGRPIEVSEKEIEAGAQALERRLRFDDDYRSATVSRIEGETLALRIEVPGLAEEQAGDLVKLISIQGELLFAIVADRTHHARLAELVESDPSANDPKQRYLGSLDEPHGVWADVGSTDALKPTHRLEVRVMPLAFVRDGKTGELLTGDALNEAVEEIPLRHLQVLLAFDPARSIGSNDFQAMRADVNVNDGSPSISFTMTPEGGVKLGVLTAVHTQGVADGDFHFMAIVLDGEILSAPRLTSQISDRGQITGQFTQKEVDHIVHMMREGSLPVRLERQPVSAKYHEPVGS